MEDITVLKERWFELYPDFPEQHEAILATVARWEWANGPRYDPRPFYFQREHPRGRLLRKTPASGNRGDHIWKCGYDDQGYAIVTHYHHGTWEDLYRFTKPFIEVMLFQIHYQILRAYRASIFRMTVHRHF